MRRVVVTAESTGVTPTEDPELARQETVAPMRNQARFAAERGLILIGDGNRR